MTKMSIVPAPPIAVIGGASTTPAIAEVAFEVGGEIARRGAVLLCGGRGGVMEHAARGAVEGGGVTVGVLPGRPGEDAPNAYLRHRIHTDMGQARNQILVLSSVAVIGVGGGWGTLSEIALALKHRIPVVLLSSLDVRPPDGRDDPLLFQAKDPAHAVATALNNARSFS